MELYSFLCRVINIKGVRQMNDFAIEVAKNALKFSFDASFKAVTALPFFNLLASLFSDQSMKKKLEDGLSIHQYIILTAVVFAIESIVFGGLILNKIFVDGFGISNVTFAVSMIIIGALIAKLTNQIIKLSVPYYLAFKILMS